jgi:acetolactate synthase-1/2/3 large subunit
MSSCGEALVELLESTGTTTVFGIPGVHTLELYRGLTNSGIRHVTPRHEQGAGFMADAWARVTGRPGVCILISGPGLTNAITPIAQAYQDSIPLLVISGALPADQHGFGEIHDLPDQQGLLDQITAFSHTVTHPDELPEVLGRAFDVFESGRPRPVHIGLPIDVSKLPAGDVGRRPLVRTATAPVADPAAVQDAAARLAAAQRPLILLGGGARDAGLAALAIARRIGAPIGLTINGRGTVDHDDPLCLGSALSFAPVDQVLREADAVVLAGAELSHLELWGLSEPLELHGVIRIDVDPGQLDRRYPSEVGLLGDATATLQALDAALADLRPEPDAARVAAAQQRVADVTAAIEWPPSVAEFLDVVAALDAALPADRIVTGDSTKPAYAANHALPMHAPRSWLMPIGYGCLGVALPMAIGAKLAAPDRPVVALAGDGGFMFTMQELATARDLGMALPVVVYDNSGYGEIRDAMDEAGVTHLGTDVTTHDLPAIARGFGIGGVRVGDASELEAALRTALEASGPTVIELRPASRQQVQTA